MTGFIDPVSFQKTSERTVAKNSCCGEVRRKKGREEGWRNGREKKGKRTDITCSKLV